MALAQESPTLRINRRPLDSGAPDIDPENLHRCLPCLPPARPCRALVAPRPGNGLNDQVLCFFSVAPLGDLHPLAGFAILAVRNGVLDLAPSDLGPIGVV